MAAPTSPHGSNPPVSGGFSLFRNPFARSNPGAGVRFAAVPADSIPDEITKIQQEYLQFKQIPMPKENRAAYFQEGSRLQREWRGKIEAYQAAHQDDAVTIAKMIETFEATTKQKFVKDPIPSAPSADDKKAKEPEMPAARDESSDQKDKQSDEVAFVVRIPGVQVVVHKSPGFRSALGKVRSAAASAAGYLPSKEALATAAKSVASKSKELASQAKEDLSTRIFGVDLSLPPMSEAAKAEAEKRLEAAKAAAARDDALTKRAFASLSDAFVKSQQEKEQVHQIKGLSMPAATAAKPAPKRPVVSTPAQKPTPKPEQRPQRFTYAAPPVKAAEPEISEEEALANIFPSSPKAAPKDVPSVAPAPAARDWSKLKAEPAKRDWSNLVPDDRLKAKMAADAAQKKS